ncbi:hypothetical protein VTL71DRAFT_5574 [Oculimacula yallundae]|uniref:C2H2-type domain-containing protein n=1 Tax=Oculimacula yallundae TaxID=86028 RepID=A0ABR4C362_9HELO
METKSSLMSPPLASFSPQEEVSSRRSDVSDDEISVLSSQGEPPITISALYSDSLCRLNVLIPLTQETMVVREVQELGSRLQIWAGNHGAHRTTIIISGGDNKGNLSDLSYDSSSGSECSLTGSQKYLIGVPDSPLANDYTLTLGNKLQIIRGIITSLYKFSITLQNPAHRDRTARATKINMDFWSQFDLKHIQDKFPKCLNERLVSDLAQANTKRRQLFAYHKRHQRKVQHLPEASFQTDTNIQIDLVTDIRGQNILPIDIGAPTVLSSNTILTQTTVSTIRPPMVNIAISVSQRSQRTNISIGPESSYQELLSIPPPPDDACEFESPFVCPYCRSIIAPRDRIHWETHVLDDLRPYICTFGDCASAAVLFFRYSEWKAHELRVHRREWFCNFCNTIFDTRKDFTEHIHLRHTSIVTGDDQLGPLLSLCERTSTRDEDCPLCKSFSGNVHSLQEHLARHLRQLALYTLPKISGDDSEVGQGESHVVNLRPESDFSSRNTSQELLNISDEQFEQALETSWFTPPNSPFQSPVESEIPISWDFFQHIATMNFLRLRFPRFVTHTLHKHETFVICDAGEETVDVASYHVKQLHPTFDIEPVTIAAGRQCGYIFINLAFKNWLRHLIGADNYRILDQAESANKITSHDYEGEKMRLLMKRFDIYKRKFARGQRDIKLDLPEPLKDLCLEGKVVGGQITITYADMRSFFDPEVDSIVELLQGQILQIEHAHRRARFVLLFGSFAESPYLQEEIQNSLELRRLRLMIADTTSQWQKTKFSAELIKLLSNKPKEITSPFPVEFTETAPRTFAILFTHTMKTEYLIDCPISRMLQSFHTIECDLRSTPLAFFEFYKKPGFMSFYFEAFLELQMRVEPQSLHIS